MPDAAGAGGGPAARLLAIEDERLGLSPSAAAALLALLGLGTASALAAALRAGPFGAAGAAAIAALAILAGGAWGTAAGAMAGLATLAAVAPAAAGAAAGDALLLLSTAALAAAAGAAAGAARDRLDAAHVYRGLRLREAEAEIHLLDREAAGAAERTEALSARLEDERRLTAAAERLQRSARGEAAARIAAAARETLGPRAARAVLFIEEDGGPTAAAVDPPGGPPAADDGLAAAVWRTNRPLIARDRRRAPSGGEAFILITGFRFRTRRAGRAADRRAAIRIDGAPGAVFGIDDLRLLDHLAVAAALALAADEYHAEMERLATVDSLTGTLRRGALDEVLEAECRRATRYGLPLSLLYVDLDRFKQVNDSFGHAAGDDVLARAAGVLLRAAPSGAAVGRLGGEEFAVLLPERPVEEAVRAAEAIRAAVREGVARPEGGPLTVSIGVAAAPTHATDPAALIAAADAALYRAKNGGRDRVEAAT